LLKSELIIQRRHLALLIEQRSTLLAGDQEGFARMHTLYEAFTHELELHACRRVRILGGETIPLRPLMAKWAPRDRKLGYDLLDAVRKVIQQVHKVAQQNSQMVSNQLTYIQFILSVMVRAGRNNWGYASPIGNGSAFTENIFLNQVA
jgi:hypothetical protein